MEIQELDQKEVVSGDQPDFLPINGTDYIEFYVGDRKSVV